MAQEYLIVESNSLYEEGAVIDSNSQGYQVFLPKKLIYTTLDQENNTQTVKLPSGFNIPSPSKDPAFTGTKDIDNNKLFSVSNQAIVNHLRKIGLLSTNITLPEPEIKIYSGGTEVNDNRFIIKKEYNGVKGIFVEINPNYNKSVSGDYSVVLKFSSIDDLVIKKELPEIIKLPTEPQEPQEPEDNIIKDISGEIVTSLENTVKFTIRNKTSTNQSVRITAKDLNTTAISLEDKHLTTVTLYPAGDISKRDIKSSQLVFRKKYLEFVLNSDQELKLIGSLIETGEIKVVSETSTRTVVEFIPFQQKTTATLNFEIIPKSNTTLKKEVITSPDNILQREGDII